MDENEKKCYGFICVFIILLILAMWFFPLLASFFAFFGAFWYITLPSIFILIFTYRIVMGKTRYKQLYLSFDNVGNQEKFEKKYGRKALEEGKLTKYYILWLMKDVPRSRYYTKENKLNDIIVLVIAYILFTVIILYLVEFYPIDISWIFGA
jgi:energy-coupling factor transporter transmembrane protein EcfT